VATHIGIGFSQKSNVALAAQEASILAKKQAQQQFFDLVLILSSVHYNPADTLETVRQNFKQTKIIGCSTAGIILADRIETRGIAILAIKSTEIKFGVGASPSIVPGNFYQAGSQLAQSTSLNFGPNRRQLFLLLTDGLIENNSIVIKGIREAFNNMIPVVGAGSSDDFRFQKTFQFCQDQSLTNAAVGLIMGGEMKIGIGLKHGFKPLGKPRIIDHAQGNIIKTIDGQKAATVLAEYFGEDTLNFHAKRLSRMAMLYPLGIYIENEGEYLLRYVLDINPDGAIICQGNIPQGARVHIMLGNKDSYKQAAVDAANEVRHLLLGKLPKFFIIFESLTRHKLLGKSSLLEVQMIREILGYTTPMIGMYSLGEIAALKSIDYIAEPYLQNQMILILAIA